jgi:fructose-1,6-bisphosphatase I
MTSLLLAIQMACKTISNLVHRAGLAQEEGGSGSGTTTTNESTTTTTTTSPLYTDGRYYSMTRLDQLSTAVLQNALKFTGKCQVQKATTNNTQDVADHQPGVLMAKLLDSNLMACFDPLDGSGNADASICTGTVFGVFAGSESDSGSATSSTSNSTEYIEPTTSNNNNNNNDNDDDWMTQVLQPAQQMKAAGYCLYSSATVLVFTLGEEDPQQEDDGSSTSSTGVQGFTLDPQTQEFVLTHRNLTIPTRGTVYSCNEANAPGWQPAVQQFFHTLKTGTAKCCQPRQDRYALRYVGSLVGDVHRTLLYGGLFGTSYVFTLVMNVLAWILLVLGFLAHSSPRVRSCTTTLHTIYIHVHTYTHILQRIHVIPMPIPMGIYNYCIKHHRWRN